MATEATTVRREATAASLAIDIPQGAIPLIITTASVETARTLITTITTPQAVRRSTTAVRSAAAVAVASMAEARLEAAAAVAEVAAASGEDDSGKVRGYPEAPYEAPKPPPNLPEGR